MEKANFFKYLLLSFLLMTFSSNAIDCDIDNDGDVDRADLTLLKFERGQPVTGPDDPRDPNDDGVINNVDLRQCSRSCTLPRCAIPAANQAPIADAGPDQSEPIGSLIQLDGSNSSDADGDALTYNWLLLTVPAGSTAILSDSTAAMPTFSIDVTGDYTAQLIVNDGTVDSAADTVLISTANTPPVADAGPNQSGQVFDTITLDGSGSDDANNDPLTFLWSQITRPAGSTATLNDPTNVMPSFDIDVTGDYVFELIVNDGLADSAADSVTVSTDNTPPIADAGPDQSGQVGDTITLDGSASSDVNGDPLTYRWSFTSVPAGSGALLSDTTAAMPSFDIDEPGDYILQLIVNDGTADSAADTVLISTDNTAPVADAGPDDSAEMGDTVTLDGSGSTDVDGDTLTYIWSFTQVPAGSTASLSDPAAVMPTFVLDVTGDYTVQLIVNDGNTDSVPDVVLISTENTPPVADAGPDQTPLVGDTVTLDGSASSDANGDGLTYSWFISDNPAGSAVALSDNTAVMPTLDIDLPGTYEIQLTVNDGSADSAADSVMLITANSAPVAEAGADQTAFVGETVTLDGTASTDVDGDALTYNWSLLAQPVGSTSSLSDDTATMPTLLIDAAGTYQLQLIVNDGTVDSAPDTVTVSTDNSPPVADAGADQNPFVNDLVTLDGSASSDVDGDGLSYVWSFTSVPLGSAATLSDNAAVMPTFTVDETGNYVAQLIVNDGTVDSAPDTVSISTQNTTPNADAGPDQSVDLNDTVTLDGSGSSDVDGDPLSYAWSLTNVPAGSSASLTDSTVVSPQFDVDQVGSYTAQLVVNDGTVDSAPDTITVSTNNTRPVADAGPDQTPQVGNTATLDGSASSDADGDPLTYSWSISSAPAGSTAALSTPNAVSTDINIDLPGTYVVQLIVNDGTIDSVANTVLLVTQNRAPTADAGVDQSVSVGADILLDGNGSSDPDGDTLTYAWTVVSSPSGSPLQGTTRTGVTPAAFVPDLEGTYVIQLIVNDGALLSAPDLVDVTVTIGLQTLTLALDSPRVGVARSIGATVTLGLPAPAGGVTVDLSSNATGIATVTPLSVFIPEGITNAAVTVNGVTEGSADITAAATGYNDDTVNVLVTSALITLGDPGVLAPDQVASLAVSISSPAPAGGLTVNLVSSNSNIVSVDASVFIPEGLQVAAANPQITGDQIGTATITATSDLFAPDSRDIDVSLTLSFAPNPTTVVESSTSSVAINLSAPAPTGGLTVNLASSDTNIATAPTSVVVPQGQLSALFDVSGITVGNTQITASSVGIPDAQLDVEVTNAPPINLGAALTIGRNLQVGRGGALGQAAPAGNLIVTLTSSDSNVLQLSNSVSGAGSTSIQVQVNAGSVGISTFFVHALANTGSSQVFASAPGYSNGSLVVNLVPSGVAIQSPGNFTTTNFANNTNIQLRSYRLNPTTFARVAIQSVRGGFDAVVPITSSDNNVGTMVTSPVTIPGGTNFINAVFDPAAPGTTQIALGTATGFDTPSNFQSVTATVNAPDITVSNVTVGDDLQSGINISLQSAPPSPVDVTITSSNPSVAILSDNASSVGSGVLVISGVTGTNVGAITLQGLSQGTSTITVTAAGYNNGSNTATVVPSGFVIQTPGNFATTNFAANTNMQLRSYRLNPSTLAPLQIQVLRAGLNVDIPLTSSDTNVGVIVSSPVTMNSGTNFVNAQFDPMAGGTTQISLVTPAGFDTPDRLQSITATVNAANVNIGNATVGRNLQQAVFVSLQSAPPGPVDVTVTSSDPSIAIISDSGTTTGSGSVTFTGITGTSVGNIFVQGVAEGAVSITASASGYNSGVNSTTVVPSGFAIQSPGNFTTTSFSNNTSLSIRSYRLNPGTLTLVQIQNVRGGLNVDIPISSSDTNVGTFGVSPVTMSQNSNFVAALFDPVAAGIAQLAITTPTGFDTPANNQSITATVRAPNINIADTTVGEDLQIGLFISLEAAPPSPVDVVVTTNSAATAIVSDNATSAGSNTVTFSGVTGTTVGTIFAQGLARGVTTFTVTAAGYNDGNSTVTVDPSGFAIQTPSVINTTVAAGNSNIQIRPYRLNPTTLNIVQIQTVRGGLSVDVDVTSSATAVGSITTSPLTFVGNDNSESTQFDPAAMGTTQIEVVPPAGFDSPSNFRTITANVNP